MPSMMWLLTVSACMLAGCKSESTHNLDASNGRPVDARGDAVATDGASSDARTDAAPRDAAIDATPPARVDYWPCSQLAQISGAKSEYYRYTLVPVATDFAIGADKHGYIANMEIDQGNCQSNPGAYTCTGFVLPNDVVGGYDAVNASIVGVCGSNYSPSQFGNVVPVWGSVSTASTSYTGTVTPVTCTQTATLAFSSQNDSYSFNIKYELYTVPSGQRAMIGHEGLTSIDQFDNFAGNLNGHTNCSSFYTCTGMPTGTVTTDALGNTYYNGQLLVVCQATYTDTTLAETFTQGAAEARVVHWSEQ